MNIIADTNVWYNISDGRLDPNKIKSAGHRLLATPTSFLEIKSLIDDHNFMKRRKVAQAVVEHADEIAKDCEYHLANLWRLPVADPAIPWLEGFKAIAQATCASEIQNIPLTKDWRTLHWEDFRDKVVDTIDHYIPGYKATRAKGQCKHIKRNHGEKLLKTSAMRECVIKCTFWRALWVVDQQCRQPSHAEYDFTEPLVSPYVDAYIEYLVGCATKFAPQSNDLGDSECFLYLQDGSAFLTADERWVDIAMKACPLYFFDLLKKVP